MKNSSQNYNKSIKIIKLYKIWNGKNFFYLKVKFMLVANII